MREQRERAADEACRVWGPVMQHLHHQRQGGQGRRKVLLPTHAEPRGTELICCVNASREQMGP